MKKIMNLLIACAFSLTIFAGCNATNSDSNTSNNTNSTPAVNTNGDTNGNIANQGFVAQQGDWIYYYYNYGYGAYKIKTDGTERNRI
jgi:hypothetical protein